MGMIPKLFLDANVMIGYEDHSRKCVWFGSGFIVARKESADIWTLYLITNRHILFPDDYDNSTGRFIHDKPPRGKIFVRFNSTNIVVNLKS